MRHDFPYARAGQVIGLLGGSFDPAHAGHAMITKEALKRFGLDRVWWLVSPGNPLKTRGPAPLPQRMEHAREVIDDPRVRVTDIEAHIGTRYTARTLRRLKSLYPGVRFVWLMGADNLGQLDRWQEWRWIMDNVPVGVLARPGQRISARTSKAARVYGAARLPSAHSTLLGRCAAPCWCFVNVPMIPLSSSAIRKAGQWHAGSDNTGA
ncbi:nicotinate-nucleotide adenylyltransferase [Oceanicola sp. 22II-s10i]|uniref:nicotinate-nucleotide adenylyltransferase n=1 Tax=Oceanicola sp. 22II-s10i TaxID=1317116 RepID=UPI000B527881|nr:nicotinate-nucleotide adenylyltransferase [Oceanicola sp. 22II-s10i]OWU86704.1 nicotinate-nucleotide adenylyltransferase [Oceanicola sp. 22II-s10i]